MEGKVSESLYTIGYSELEVAEEKQRILSSIKRK